MNKMKRLWGLIPITAFLIIKLILMMIEQMSGLVLRDLPSLFLFVFLIISILILIFYFYQQMSMHIRGKFARSVVLLLCFFLALVNLISGMIQGAFAYHSDKIVIENGIVMVARDISYLNFGMEYYEYKNAVFRGKQMLKQISNKTYWLYDEDGKLIETGTYNQ